MRASPGIVIGPAPPLNGLIGLVGSPATIAAFITPESLDGFFACAIGANSAAPCSENNDADDGPFAELGNAHVYAVRSRQKNGM